MPGKIYLIQNDKSLQALSQQPIPMRTTSKHCWSSIPICLPVTRWTRRDV